MNAPRVAGEDSPIPRGRGHTPRIAAALFAVTILALTGAPAADAFVYWANSDTGAIGRAELDSTGVNQSFVAGGSGPAGMALNGVHFFWANSGDGTIGRAGINGNPGGVEQDFITGASGPGAVAVDGAHVYWTNDDGTIGRSDLDGTDVDQGFLTGASGPRGVAVDASHIYWANSETGTIGRADLDGSPGSVDQSFIAGAGGPIGVAVDGAHVYWTNDDGTIGRADRDGSPGSVDQSFIAGASGPTGVATDATHVFWANSQTGTIGRADLDGSPGSVDQSFIAGASNPGGLAVSAAFGEARIEGSVLEVEAAPGTENRMQVFSSGSGTEWVATDDRGPMIAGPGCAQVGDAAHCPKTEVASVEATTGNFGDHFRATVDVGFTIDLGIGNDQSRGGSVSDLIMGGPGDDNLEGRDGPDVLDGGEGRDEAQYLFREAHQPVEVTLDGLANDGGLEDGHADHILANVEDAMGTPGSDILVGNGGVNRLTGSAGDDQIAGREGNDQLFGQGGDDTLAGEGGNDSLDGGDGGDVHDGGANTDVALYKNNTASQPVTVTINGVANDGGAADGNADNVLTNVENVTSGAGADTLTGSANANSLSGGAGVDVLDGGAGPDSLDGGADRDLARYATRGPSEPVQVSLDGMANDGGELDGGGNDNVRPTVEKVVGGAGGDTLIGNDAANKLTGKAGPDIIAGGPGDDALLGDEGVDALSGEAARDSLDGGPGPDTLDGGTERDVARYASRTAAQPVEVTLDDVADDGGDLDGSADNVLASVENVIGGAGDDILTGSGVTNVLTGKAGEDELHGLAGNDEIRANGDGFDDTITCGAGTRDHVFADATDSFPPDGPDACEIVH